MMSESQGHNIFVPSAQATNDGNPAPIYPDLNLPSTQENNNDASDVMRKIPGLPKVAEAINNVDMAQVAAKVDSIKKWTIGTFKNSKQQLLENMGKIDKTVDSEFEQECENLKDLHKRYGAIVAASKQFSSLLTQLSIAEKTFSESLYQLSMKEHSIKAQCTTTSESMKKIADHAAALENCLRFFLSSMETLHGKAITDTLDTIYGTEAARIEYDVYRHEQTSLQSQATALPSAIEEATKKTEAHREKYESLKTDVRVKLRLLEENRVKVMSSQLERLQAALAAYFSGNAAMLESAVRELNALAPGSQQSFLLQ